MVLLASCSGSSYHIRESLWKHCLSIYPLRGCCYSSKALHSAFMCLSSSSVTSHCLSLVHGCSLWREVVGYILLLTPLSPSGSPQSCSGWSACPHSALYPVLLSFVLLALLFVVCFIYIYISLLSSDYETPMASTACVYLPGIWSFPVTARCQYRSKWV